jgi:hypothetical protein
MNVPAYIPTIMSARIEGSQILFAAKAHFRQFSWGMPGERHQATRHGTTSSHWMKPTRPGV